MLRYIKNTFTLLYYLALCYFSFLLIIITLQYIPLRFDVAFLKVKTEEIKLPHYQVAFFTHVYTSIFVLLFGIPQFINYFKKKFILLHRNLGKLYVFTILLFASPSGLIMGYYANGGFFSQLSFMILSVLWFFFTYLAYKRAVCKSWKKHQQFMIRSYALTLSAISLRLFKWIIATNFHLPPMDNYRLVSWLGWVVNLIIAEMIILYQLNKSKNLG